MRWNVQYSPSLKDKICINLWEAEESKKNSGPSKWSLCANEVLLREEYKKWGNCYTPGVLRTSQIHFIHYLIFKQGFHSCHLHVRFNPSKKFKLPLRSR